MTSFYRIFISLVALLVAGAVSQDHTRSQGQFPSRNVSAILSPTSTFSTFSRIPHHTTSGPVFTTGVSNSTASNSTSAGNSTVTSIIITTPSVPPTSSSAAATTTSSSGAGSLSDYLNTAVIGVAAMGALAFASF